MLHTAQGSYRMKVTCTLYLQYMYTLELVQWNLYVMEILYIGHLSNEDTVGSPKHRTVYKSTSELGTPQDSKLGPNSVLYREVPQYTGQPAGSQWCPLQRGSTVYRTANWVPMVSSIERFHCIHSLCQGVRYFHSKSSQLCLIPQILMPEISTFILIVAHPRGLDNNGDVLG